MDLGTTTVVVAFDDDDLHEHGFTKPSKRRGRGGGAAAALHLGVVRQALVEEMAAALRERGGAGEVEQLGQQGGGG